MHPQFIQSTLPIPEDARRCPVCNTPLVRKLYEHDWQWKRRQTCGHACKGWLIAHRRFGRTLPVNAAVDEHSSQAKTCAICGTSMVPREREKPSRFKKRKTCSRRCTSALISKRRWAVVPPKTCPVCQRSFVRRKNERPSGWATRVTCSTSCRSKHQYTAQGRVTPYPISFRALTIKIRARDTFCCRLCGVPENGRAHSVHHIDYVKTNLDESNLITLCLSCHGKTNHGDRSAWFALFTGMMASSPPP